MLDFSYSAHSNELERQAAISSIALDSRSFLTIFRVDRSTPYKAIIWHDNDRNYALTTSG